MKPALYFEAKGKAIPLEAWTGPWGSANLRVPIFLDVWQMKGVRLSALRAARLYFPGDIPPTHFC